ncbi:MAG TPA: DUF6259 domain-containing protein, partial [Clostridia bacterium]|nr:DUF6259 domain-containing protein [Clostridia bacterium]
MAKCLWLLVMCAVAARAATAQLGDIARISNGKLHVGLDARNGALVELIDVGSGSNLVGKADAGLWEIELAGGRKLLPRDAESFRWEHPSGEPATVLMTWGQFKAMPEMRVEVRVRLDQNEPISRWRIGLPGVDGSALRKVHFPRVMKLARSEQESLAVPVWMGQITTKPRELLAGENGKGRRFEWAYPGILSMQCTAFYGAGGLGLYAACDDTEAYRKTIAWFGDGEGGVNCEFVQLPEAVEGAREWTQPYEVLLGVFHGDWVTVAERYRSWGTNQPWAKESRLMQRKVPHWVLDTGLWVWNRGRSEEVLQPATTLQKELGLPVSVFWHWWHGCAYDAGFP